MSFHCAATTAIKQNSVNNSTLFIFLLDNFLSFHLVSFTFEQLEMLKANESAFVNFLKSVSHLAGIVVRCSLLKGDTQTTRCVISDLFTPDS